MPSCVEHPEQRAGWWCESCQVDLCQACVDAALTSASPAPLCPRCQDLVIELTPEERGVPPVSFFRSLPGTLRYPFVGNGRFILAGGVVILAALFILSMIPLIGLIALFLLLFMFAYVIVYMLEVIRASADGREEPPDWPDVDDVLTTLVVPVLQFLLIGLLAVGPSLLYLLWARDDASEVGFRGLRLAGEVLWPMAVLALALRGFWAAVNPVFLLRSIFQVPLAYGVAVGVVWGLMALEELIKAILPESPYTAPLVIVLNAALYLYFVMVEMRILGVLYATRARRLGWFGEGG